MRSKGRAKDFKMIEEAFTLNKGKFLFYICEDKNSEEEIIENSNSDDFISILRIGYGE